jgi:radical SAM protein with 4Fe4S-binding SPASM domain
MELKIEPTHRCNLRCRHCSSVRAYYDRDMTLKEFKGIAYQAWEYGFDSLVISGGEPLLWEPLFPALEYVKLLPLPVTIYTSGNPVLGATVLSALKTFGVQRIIFGVHGALGETHDAITRIPGSFIPTTTSIKNAIEAGFGVELHFVPVRSNFKETMLLLKMADGLEVKKVSLLRFVPHGRGADFDEELTPHEHEELRQILTQARCGGFSDDKLRFGSPFNFLLLRHPGDAQTCAPGVGKATVGPDLRVFPCDAFKHIAPWQIGLEEPHPSLAWKDLRWCFNSPYFREVRRMALAKPTGTCKSCNSFSSCGGGCLAQKILAGLKASDRDPACYNQV